MFALVLIGFLGGLITGISPCILPVLPVIFFSGTQSGETKARPYRVIAGLVLSFSVVTLVGSALLSLLHLPQDAIRWAGLVALTAAVSGKLNPNVNLVDTLNGSEFTVFAPTDAAFAKIDPATIEKLKTDSALLNSILTYHVVPGQASPAQVAGTHTTVQGGDLTVTGAGNNLKVNNAGVVCGGVRTANATVYLIDTVLMPPAA